MVIVGFFVDDSGVATCSKCGGLAVRTEHRWKCETCEGPAPKPGLGDMIASGLERVGITKERVQAVASRVGIKDCGCGGRQALANKLGNKYLGLPPGSTKSP